MAQDYEETLPGGATHIIREFSDRAPLDDTPVFTVPKGHVFMMGDNRDNSADSRVKGGIGIIPMEDLIGKAEVITYSVADCGATVDAGCAMGLPLKRFASLIR